MSDHTANLPSEYYPPTPRHWYPAERIQSDATSKSQVVQAGGVTRDAPWQPLANPRAGIEELAWFEDNQKGLVRFAGRWIAIVGQEVIASGETFDEAYDEASRLNYSDMLILPVPKEPGEDRYLIA